MDYKIENIVYILFIVGHYNTTTHLVTTIVGHGPILKTRHGLPQCFYKKLSSPVYVENACHF